MHHKRLYCQDAAYIGSRETLRDQSLKSNILETNSSNLWTPREQSIAGHDANLTSSAIDDQSSQNDFLAHNNSRYLALVQ